MFESAYTPDSGAHLEIFSETLASERIRSQIGTVVRQQTLHSSISCTGVGLHSGTKTAMTLHPAEAGSGIRFRRVDVTDRNNIIPALWANVTDTRLNTCITNDAGVSVKTIEHLMSALAGMGLDNALIDIDGEEVPVMDGSAAPFVFLVECAGLVEQNAPRQVIKVLKRITITDGDKVTTLSPADDYVLSVDIDFAAAAIGRQQTTLCVDPATFKAEISRARTFGFEQEVEAMRAAGLGRGGSLDNAVVIAGDGKGVLNEEGLRYDNEFVRHKLLDALGDLSLAGSPLLGHFRGTRCGHALNNQLLRALFADPTAWVRVPQIVASSMDCPLRVHDVPRMVASAF
jgi:UDP-3-O-[3-hydroxymyristoyl] N-acetylglucosamine deacetylase